MTEKRAGRPVLDFIKALLAFGIGLFVVAIVLAVLSIPTLTIAGAVLLWVLWFAGVGA